MSEGGGRDRGGMEGGREGGKKGGRKKGRERGREGKRRVTNAQGRASFGHDQWIFLDFRIFACGHGRFYKKGLALKGRDEGDALSLGK